MPPPSFRSHKDGQGSILGLDRLAQDIRTKNRDSETAQSSYKSTDRYYRRVIEETPSHPGGVNMDVLQWQKVEAAHKFKRKDPVSHVRIDSDHHHRHRHRTHDSWDPSRPRQETSQSTTHNPNTSYIASQRTNQDSWDIETPIHITQEDRFQKSFSRRDETDSRYRSQRHLGGRFTSSSSSSVRHFPGPSTADTPMVSPRPISDTDGLSVSQTKRNVGVVETMDGEDDFDWKFYLADDDEYVFDESDVTQGNQRNMGRFLFESNKTKLREEEMERTRSKTFGGWSIERC